MLWSYLLEYKLKYTINCLVIVKFCLCLLLINFCGRGAVIYWIVHMERTSRLGPATDTWPKVDGAPSLVPSKSNNMYYYNCTGLLFYLCIHCLNICISQRTKSSDTSICWFHLLPQKGFEIMPQLRTPLCLITLCLT